MFKFTDPTTDKIKEILVDKKEKPRCYIGASGIGHGCARKIWYDLKGYDKQLKPIGNVTAIEDGHRTEDVMADRLRLIDGIELHTDQNGNQFGFDWGFMKGHYDGVIKGLLQAPKTWHIWENKTTKESNYNKLIKDIDTYGEKRALKQWNDMYYAQAVIYMHAEDLTRHYTTVTTPGGRDFIGIRTDKNTEFAEELIDKAKKISVMEEAPDRKWRADFWKCKMCDYRKECHDNAKEKSN